MQDIDQEKSLLAEQYDRFASKFNQLYLEGRDRGREAMNSALDKTHEQMTALGEFSAERGQELKQFLARDLDQTISSAQHLGAEAKERLHPARLGAGALSSLAAMLEFSSETLRSLSNTTRKALTYRTGELTSAGTLTCHACGQQLHLKATGHVPPCPKCNATLFSKGY